MKTIIAIWMLMYSQMVSADIWTVTAGIDAAGKKMALATHETDESAAICLVDMAQAHLKHCFIMIPATMSVINDVTVFRAEPMVIDMRQINAGE